MRAKELCRLSLVAVRAFPCPHSSAFKKSSRQENEGRRIGYGLATGIRGGSVCGGVGRGVRSGDAAARARP